jgi:hypothetical protein
MAPATAAMMTMDALRPGPTGSSPTVIRRTKVASAALKTFPSSISGNSGNSGAHLDVLVSYSRRSDATESRLNAAAHESCVRSRQNFPKSNNCNYCNFCATFLAATASTTRDFPHLSVDQLSQSVRRICHIFQWFAICRIFRICRTGGRERASAILRDGAARRTRTGLRKSFTQAAGMPPSACRRWRFDFAQFPLPLRSGSLWAPARAVSAGLRKSFPQSTGASASACQPWQFDFAQFPLVGPVKASLPSCLRHGVARPAMPPCGSRLMPSRRGPVGVTVRPVSP